MERGGRCRVGGRRFAGAMVMLRSGGGASSRAGAEGENDVAAAAPTAHASRRRDRHGPPGSLCDPLETSSVFLSLESPSPPSARSKRRSRSGAPREVSERPGREGGQGAL